MSDTRIKTALDYALEQVGEPEQKRDALELLHAVVQTAWTQLTLLPKDTKTKAAEIQAESVVCATVLRVIETELGTIPMHTLPKTSRTQLVQSLPTKQQPPK